MQVFVNMQVNRFFADVVGDDPCVHLWPPVVHTVLHALIICVHMLYCAVSGVCVCVWVCVCVCVCVCMSLGKAMMILCTCN